MFKCIFCETSFNEAKLYRRHLNNYIDKDKDIIAAELERTYDTTINKAFKCDLCSHEFTTKDNWKKHKCKYKAQSSELLKSLNEYNFIDYATILQAKEIMDKKFNEFQILHF